MLTFKPAFSLFSFTFIKRLLWSKDIIYSARLFFFYFLRESFWGRLKDRHGTGKKKVTSMVSALRWVCSLSDKKVKDRDPGLASRIWTQTIGSSSAPSYHHFSEGN